MSDTSSIKHDSPQADRPEQIGADIDRLRHSDSTAGGNGSTAEGPELVSQADGSTADHERIGSSIVPVSLFAAPDDQTVISLSPPVPAPSHRLESTPTELGRLLEGERLDHFELEEFIGGGGMGAVFRGVDTLLGRTVAVKVLSRHNGGEEETSRRFNNEAQSAARLDHENIARVYYVGQDRGWHYIVFEFIEGENLRDIVAQNGPLPVAEAVHYVMQIAEALAHAASRDVVHRDIKPSNVLVTRGHRAKLVDMGLARLHQVETSKADITASGVTLGTFDYISPEQARDPRVADIRSDLYSLGCTMYYMLTGRPPFPEGTVLQKLLQHQGDEAPDPREIRRDLPPALCDILRKLLAKNPADRYQSAETLLEDLSVIAGPLGLVSRSRPAAWAETPRMTSRWSSKYLPWAIPVALLIAIVAVIEVVGNLNGTMEEPPRPQPLITSRMEPDSLLTEPGESSTNNVMQPIDDVSPPLPTNGESPTQGETATPQKNNAPNSGGAATNSLPPATSLQPIEEEPPPGASLGEASSTDTDKHVELDPTSTPQPAVTVVNVVLGPGSAEPRHFSSIESALRAATTGDVIELRFDGVSLERAWRIEKQKITIRAADGFRPIVKFIPSGTDPVLQPRSMITVSGGELLLVNMQLQMELPFQLQSDSWSLFHLVLAERLRLDRTSITLKNAAADGTAYHQEVSVFKVDAPVGAGMIISEVRSPTERTNIELRNCIVRGEADLLSGDLLGMTNVSWENGLFSTSERLASLTGDDFQQRQPGELKVELQHLTADMRRGLMAIQTSNETPELFTTRLDVAESILLIGAAPLFDCSGSGNIKDFRGKLIWKGERNFYQGVGIFWRIDDQFADDFAELTWSDWQAFWGPGNEAAQRPGTVAWAGLPDKLKPHWQRTVEDFLLDLDDATNPAIGASTDGTTNAGMQPDLLPRTFPLETVSKTNGLSQTSIKQSVADEVVIPFKRLPIADGGVIPARFEQPELPAASDRNLRSAAAGVVED